MSRALMSSRAGTATCCRRLRSMLSEGMGSIEPVATNIGQNAVGEQTPHGSDAGGFARDRCPDRACGNRLWRHTLTVDGAERQRAQERGIGDKPGVPFRQEGCRQPVIECYARTLGDDEMGEIEQLAPTVPVRQP